ncbi:hypothetical protein LCGC14_1390750 [marine sediment metagenome]|uniref:Peptidase M15A C-terminal domain-containing protein n=1 Tax=marine sediment metagenome TaxID=412755 RepID=A0A0F9MFN4_9ZZZZ
MRLSPNFTLEEMPCYERAGPTDVARIRTTAERVLQPVRDRWGLTRVSSWKWWRSGCTPRSGSHAHGGTVDFTVPGADLRAVFDWGLKALMPLGYIGRWIYEPELRGPAGEVLQGAHIHMAPVADMVSAYGPSRGDSAAYVEGPQNVYTPVPGWGGASGAYGDPIELEGLTVTVSRSVPWWAKLFAAGIVFGLLFRSTGG